MSETSISLASRSWPSIGVFLTLLLILAASFWVFAVLSRQWTQQRQDMARNEWANEHKFRIAPIGSDGETAPLPPPLDRLAELMLWVNARLTSASQTLIRFTSTSAAGIAQGDHWNLLIQRIDANWPPTALRPVIGEKSVLDLFSLSSFPSLGATDRFVVFGTDSISARVLSDSSARGLLPPDVGLLLCDASLVLDFSSRPFDPIEFDRMLAIMQQIVLRLPALGAR